MNEPSTAPTGSTDRTASSSLQATGAAVHLVGWMGPDVVGSSDVLDRDRIVRMHFVGITLGAASRLNYQAQQEFADPGVLIPCVVSDHSAVYANESAVQRINWQQTGSLQAWGSWIAENHAHAPADEACPAYREELEEMVSTAMSLIAGVFPRWFAYFAQQVLEMPAVLSAQYHALADEIDAERRRRGDPTAVPLPPAVPRKAPHPTDSMSYGEKRAWWRKHADNDEEFREAIAAINAAQQAEEDAARMRAHAEKTIDDADDGATIPCDRPTIPNPENEP